MNTCPPAAWTWPETVALLGFFAFIAAVVYMACLVRLAEISNEE